MAWPPLPPVTHETAVQTVRLAEDALAYSENCEWRNRAEFFTGRPAIQEFLIANGPGSSTTA